MEQQIVEVKSVRVDGMPVTYGRCQGNTFFVQTQTRSGLKTREVMTGRAFLRALNLHGINDPAMRAWAVL